MAVMRRAGRGATACVRSAAVLLALGCLAGGLALGSQAWASKSDAPVLDPSEIQPGRTISILGVGDILTHREIIDQALTDSGRRSPDFYEQLKGVQSLVSSADLAVCHLEFPMGSTKGPWTAWPDLPAGPPQLAKAVAKAGFDSCSTVSNHAFDQGFLGLSRVLNALDKSGVAHAGTARTEEEASTPTIVDVKGVPVALLAYSFSFNGMPVPAGREWSANLIDVKRIIKEAEHARRLGARLVVLSLHAGYEGDANPSSQQLDVVREVAASGMVDLVLGHHAHVVQPVDRVNGMWVAYGHGNLLSAQSRRDPRSGDGLATMFTFTEQEDGTFEATDARGYVVHNDDFPFRLSLVPRQGAATDAQAGSWSRTEDAVLDFGADRLGFHLVRWGKAA